MHGNHLKKSKGRVFKERRHLDVTFGFKFAALNA